jgi:hypothetical protein
VDDDNVVDPIECHDLQLDAAIIRPDPDQPSVVRRRGRDALWLDRVDHRQGVSLAHPVAPGGSEPPKRPIHLINVAQKYQRLRFPVVSVLRWSPSE